MSGLNLLEAIEALQHKHRVRMTGRNPFTPGCPELEWDGTLRRAYNSTEHQGHLEVLGCRKKWTEATYEIIGEKHD